MLNRVLEPEVMDLEVDAAEYNAIDNQEANEAFVRDCLPWIPQGARVLDLGTGPGQIPVLLAKHRSDIHITAIDLADEMLALARNRVQQSGYAERIELLRVDGKKTEFAADTFDAVISNSTMHHIPDPETVFKEVGRISKDGAGLFMRDLLRPAHDAELHELVTEHASDCSPYQRQLFHQSLHAGLTPHEIADFCAAANIENAQVKRTSDRHWTLTRKPRSNTTERSADIRMKIIRRDDIPTVTSITQDGVTHNLGILKDFRKDAQLREFLPDSARLAMSWVHLGPGRRLDDHEHPTASMIVVGHGTGRTTGDIEADFADGDIVIVPPGSRHGFLGTGDTGYWALSIQFGERGLYEDTAAPLVQFEERSASEQGLSALLQRNQRFQEEHKNNALFGLISSTEIEDERIRHRLLDSIQVWSNYYQKAVLCRTALCDDPKYLTTFQTHLDEEYGHNTKLAKDRGKNLTATWDPVLDATSAWFAWKMLAADNAEKAVLVHLVLEGGSSVFHKLANPIMQKFGETNHFGVHDDADEGHEEMGIDLLLGLEPAQYQRLMNIQTEGWDMLNTLCERMVDVARKVQ